MTSSPRKLYIVIGCDTDPDRAGFVDGASSGTLSWRGMLEGIPRLRESVDSVVDSVGQAPVFTWLLRVDEQVRRTLGEYGSVLRTHRPFLESLESSGDELGWHPHFWRFDEKKGVWFQEAVDIPWQIDMLRAAHRDYMSVFPGRAKSVRMGWDYHNDRTLQTLDDLGVVVDFSAIPGLRTWREGTAPKGENLFDWYATPRRPYTPSRSDYRRPASGGETAGRLLEAPNFVSSSMAWGVVSGLQFARKTGDPRQLWQAIRRPTYWISITGRPRLFAPLCGELRSSLRRGDARPIFFITYFHPDELLPNRSSLYSLESVRDNLQSLLLVCREANVKTKFIAASKIPGVM